MSSIPRARQRDRSSRSSSTFVERAPALKKTVRKVSIPQAHFVRVVCDGRHQAHQSAEPSLTRVYAAPDAAVFGDEYLVEKLETKAGWSAPEPDEDWMTGYPQEIQDFVEAIAHGREPLSGRRWRGMWWR